MSCFIKSLKTFLFYYLFFCLLFIVLAVTKSLYGAQRPIFLNLCKPSIKDCEIGTLVTNYNCTNPQLSERSQRDISTSFPSGHASLAAYFAVFFAVFLHNKFNSASSEFKVWVPCAQTLLLIYALYCSVTRITDHYHHPRDVIFGIIFGASFAVYNVTINLIQFH